MVLCMQAKAKKEKVQPTYIDKNIDFAQGAPGQPRASRVIGVTVPALVSSENSEFLYYRP